MVSYNKDRAYYKREILKQKRLDFQKFIDSTVIRNTFGVHYDIAKDRRRKPMDFDKVIKDDNSYTSTTEECSKEIPKFHFPWKDCNIEYIDSNTGPSEPPFDQFDIERSLQEMEADKAPEEDGFSAEIIKEIYKANPD